MYLMKRTIISDFYAYKVENRKFSVITCYDYTTAALIADTGIDMVMVGDSAAQVMLGESSTLPATMDFMAMITRAVARGCPSKLLSADMPFLSYQTSHKDAILNAGRFITESGADIVKIEVTEKQADIIEAVSSAGIAVMAHIGMRPQSIGLTGRLRAEATTQADASALLETAEMMQAAGARMLLLEGVAREAARTVSEKIRVPVIGCGSGPDCDGQVLVISDVLGLNKGFMPKFARKYADAGDVMTRAISRYDQDVKSGDYPSDAESYHMKKG
jgi:3-methyl-2-oxobutanoate hydroxymethyltransferase